MRSLTIKCKACGFLGSGFETDEELDEEALEGLDNEDEECPKCGAPLTVVESEEPARRTGVTTFEGGETDGN